ncbi:MAG TPA: Sua5/YciO/YrdC/YwlC family protein [Acidimicrobiales bacterium]|jgi:tRNA A37 threonylcarbamoyladenosine synthetase subunit TsaC/SUA5/YrdC|nr:Sua5/YciO/YrdC/YwlC family protein [Acidimicrobiales bacterium]
MGEPGTDDEAVRPPVVDAADTHIGTALAEGAVVAVPGVGGYCLAVHVGSPGAEARLVAMAADPDGPHYAVGHRDDVRALTSGWTEEIERLLDRVWPGPVDVFLPRAADPARTGQVPVVNPDGAADATAPDEPDDEEPLRTGEVRVVPEDADAGGWAVTVGMPDGRALRRLCKEHGPWRTIPLNYNEPTEVAGAFDVTDVALVVDGGRRDGEPPTLVDATVSPVRVLREGALPSNFIDATMSMGERKRWFGRSRSKAD